MRETSTTTRCFESVLESEKLTINSIFFFSCWRDTIGRQRSRCLIPRHQPIHPPTSTSRQQHSTWCQHPIKIKRPEFKKDINIYARTSVFNERHIECAPSLTGCVFFIGPAVPVIKPIHHHHQLKCCVTRVFRAAALVLAAALLLQPLPVVTQYSGTSKV